MKELYLNELLSDLIFGVFTFMFLLIGLILYKYISSVKTGRKKLDEYTKSFIVTVFKYVKIFALTLIFLLLFSLFVV